jgi:hypothetical protein
MHVPVCHTWWRNLRVASQLQARLLVAVIKGCTGSATNTVCCNNNVTASASMVAGSWLSHRLTC